MPKKGDQVRVLDGTHTGYTGTIHTVNEATVTITVSPTKTLARVRHRFLAPVLPRNQTQTLDRIINTGESKWSALMIVLQQYIAIDDENTALIGRLQSV